MATEITFDSTPEEAAAYLIRFGRPGTPPEVMARVIPSVMADPRYRRELATDARTLLTDPVEIACAILARADVHEGASRG